MSDLSRELAQRVQQGLARNGWTQVKLAEKAEITEKHLSQVLNNKAVATMSLWERLIGLVGAAPRTNEPEAHKLLEYALDLRMYGERTVGTERVTWRNFDQIVEEYLRGLPASIEPSRLPKSVEAVVDLRRRMEHYYRAAVLINGEVEDTLAPALGYEPYPPGSPGYSEDKVNYAVGDHVAQSLAMEAADKIEKLQELNDDLSSGWLFWRDTYKDFRIQLRELITQLDAGVVTEEDHCRAVSLLFQGTPEVSE